MTIKQQGGVFGRNPTFNDVTVEGLVDINGGSIDGVTLGTNSAVTEAQIDDINIDGATISTSATVSSVEVNSGGTQKVYGGYTVGSGRPALYLESVGSSHDMVIKATDLVRFYDASNAENFIVDHLNNKLVSNYNLAFASGAGIDFSATSGTGTSELFDDYEEGTWTAYLRGSVAEPTPFKTATGYYTKVGDVITAWVKFDSIDATGYSGNALIYGLPFTSGSNSNPINACICNQLNTTTLVGTVNPSSTILNILQDTGSAATYSSPTTGFSLTVQVTYKE